MFGDYSRDLLRSGLIDLKAGDRDSARRYLDRALYMSSDHDVMAEAWYALSQITEDPQEKRNALENCLANDLQHARARRALAILDGKLKPDEIINADALPPAPDTLQQADAQRFVCSKCGGRMAYSPDGRSLVCEYCLRGQSINPLGGRADEEDFVLAMATARGHSKPLREQVFQCQGCGAGFILSPGQLSLTCAYCGSAHVVSLEKSGELLAPDGILPHAFDQSHAADILADWVEDLKIEPEQPLRRPRGLYVPLWSFQLGGGIDYAGEAPADGAESLGSRAPRLVRVADRWPVLLSVSIAASRKPSAPFVRLIPTFDLRLVQPYDPRYLAAWPAELYDVPMADASLDARSQAYSRLKRDLPVRLAPIQLVSTSSANLTIDSFQLDLLPVWVSEIWLDGRGHILLINGQTGALQSDIAKKHERDKAGLRDWLADLIKE
jgi:DNA-directed RNA polymerase subunit RPC12/RpoP